MKEYEAEIGGITHTFQLSDEDAKARGLDPAKDAKSTVTVSESPLVPTTESAPPQDKQVKADLEKQNKAATASNK